MQKQDKPSLLQNRMPHPFGDLRESRELLGGALRGKTIAYIVDDRDHHAESRVLRMGVFDGVGANEKSAVLKYSEFFDGKSLQADILVLRSSRLFPYRIPELVRALKCFRAENPKSAVILCVFDPCAERGAKQLAETGVVNLIDDDPPNDFELLRMASAVLERLASE